MFFNLLFFLFCITIAWLLYRFPLQRAKSTDEYRKLFYFFCMLIVFVLFNAFLAFLGFGGLKLASTGLPITSTAEIADKESEDSILLVGEVSNQNNAIYRDYIAYTDDQHLWTPTELWIDLKDGKIAITNTTYQATSWKIDPSGNSYLLPKQPVVVVGAVEDWVNLSSGEKSQSVRATIVYAGSFEEFASRARIKSLMAGGMMLLNLLAAIMIGIGPTLECGRNLKNELAAT
jgi:hypothetical protein